MRLTLIAAVIAVVLVAGCSGTKTTTIADCVVGYHNPPGDRSRCVPDSTTSVAVPSGYGTINGRYYADGGPPPPQPAHGIVGTITATDRKTRKTFPARSDARGDFTVAVPVGSYEVVARAPGISFPMTKSVTVTAGRTVDVDLAIHMT
jgi:hypothetical protein